MAESCGEEWVQKLNKKVQDTKIRLKGDCNDIFQGEKIRMHIFCTFENEIKTNEEDSRFNGSRNER